MVNLEKNGDLPSTENGSRPSIKASLQRTKIRDAVVKLRTPVWGVKVEGWYRFPMWDFVQVVAVVTLVMESGFGNLGALAVGASVGVWHLGRVSSFGMGEGVSAFGASCFEAGYARLIMV
ncbi:unnamed protein product [Prunus armeniaca]